MTLALVVVALLLLVREVSHFLAAREWAKERKSMLAAVLSRTPGEYLALDRGPTVRPETEPPVPQVGAGA